MVSVIKVADEHQLKQALQVREAVFVVEQKVPREDEYDEYDKIASHFLASDEKGIPLGAARWRETDKGIKLERFAVRKESRGQGIGSMLLESVLEDIKVKNKDTLLYLHAQIPAVSLYEKFGFQKEGDIFEECGIEHYKLIKKS